MFDYTITDDVIHTQGYESTPAIEGLLRKAYLISCKKGPRSVQKLKQLMNENPHLPALWNFLFYCYKLSGKVKHANQVNQELVEKFPDYLFGKIGLAENYLDKGEYEKIPSLLKNEKFDLRGLYPNRKVFHRSEVRGYHGIVCAYFIEIDDLENAELHLDYLQKIDGGHEVVRELTRQLDYSKLVKKITRIVESNNEIYGDIKTYEGRSYDKDIQTDMPPQFIHIEIQQLYENDLSIDYEIVGEVLSLPRTSLIEDLEKVLEDCVKRYEYFENLNVEQGWNYKRETFPTHALFFLAELKSESSLDVVLNVLRQGEDLSDFWFADTGELIFSDVLFHIGKYQLEKLKSFILEKHIYIYARNAVSTAVSKIIMANPNRRAEGINWYRDVFMYLLENQEEDGLIDIDLVGYIISDAMNFQAVELLPTIEQLFEAELVENLVCGDYETVKNDILLENMERVPLKNIYEFYEYWKPEVEQVTPSKQPNFWENSKIFEIEDKLSNIPTLQPKVGRNVPCPCGSGKKYKRCCGKK